MKTEQIIKTLRDCKQFFKEYTLSYALENNRGLLPPGKSADLIFTVEDAVCELERLNQINKRLEKERDEARELAEAERLNAWKISNHKSGWVNFSWEEGSK